LQLQGAHAQCGPHGQPESVDVAKKPPAPSATPTTNVIIIFRISPPKLFIPTLSNYKQHTLSLF